jgi:type IV fimbrial biogenesis protein FimT
MSHRCTHSSLTARTLTRGFTLIELMITLAVALVLFIVALPSFREIAIRNNVKELNNTLIYSLNLARTEAVRRGTAVRVASVSGGASWSQGWQVTDGVTVITQQGPVPTNYTVCGKSTPAGTDNVVVFTPTGILSGPTSFDLNINRPDAKPTLSQRVVVQNGGLVRNKIDTTGSPASTNSACT